MTICRYYAQGTCRFGDRCRFEHVDSNYDSYNYNQRNVGNYQERVGYGNYRNDSQYGNQRYESKNYYAGNQRSYSPDRYSDNYRYETSRHSSTYDNQYHGRSRQGYEQQPRYDEQSYVRNQQHSSSNYRNDNIYSQNRFQWLSDDYKKQTHHSVEQSKNEYASDYHTSTPKGKVPFSFKVPESEIKKTSNSHFQLDEHDQLHVELVKEDAKAWELGGQWPFTCYFPNPNKHGFPGFYDVSPEELRYIAYKAKENNSYESYVQAVQTALAQINEQRTLLQIPTPQLLSVLRQIWDGEDLYSSSKKIDPTSFIQCNEVRIENMETPTDSIPASSAAPFSFKVLTQTDSSAKPSASSFSFKLPAGTEIKPVTPVSNGDPDIYTPLEKLTEGEKEQFSASTFVLGKIPTKPPPQMLCT